MKIPASAQECSIYHRSGPPRAVKRCTRRAGEDIFVQPHTHPDKPGFNSSRNSNSWTTPRLEQPTLSAP